MRDRGYLEKKVGNLHWQLGFWEDDPLLLEQAIDSYHAALRAFRPEDRPKKWHFMTWTLSTLSRPQALPSSERSWPLIEYDIALAYMAIGDRPDDASDARALDAAISDYRQRGGRNPNEILAADNVLKSRKYGDQDRGNSMTPE